MSANANQMPMRTVLTALAAEIDIVRTRVTSVELAICRLLAQLDTSVLAPSELQDLDHALQTLTALNVFTKDIAADVGAEATFAVGAALERIKLADVQARLGGKADNTSAPDIFDGFE